MSVTKPETIAALWYLTWTANEQNKRNTVVVLMLAVEDCHDWGNLDIAPDLIVRLRKVAAARPNLSS